MNPRYFELGPSTLAIELSHYSILISSSVMAEHGHCELVNTLPHSVTVLFLRPGMIRGAPTKAGWHDLSLNSVTCDLKLPGPKSDRNLWRYSTASTQGTSPACLIKQPENLWNCLDQTSANANMTPKPSPSSVLTTELSQHLPFKVFESKKLERDNIGLLKVLHATA